jgi:xanthine dehydrogenase accessory factor
MSPEATAEPPAGAPLVLILGQSPIALAVHNLGRALGYRTAPFEWVTGDGGSGHGMPDETVTLDGAAAVVLADHGGPGERDALLSSLDAGVAYVGMVAGRNRAAEVVASLELTPDSAARLHTPAGLDIGSRTPGEVALAILAEIVASRPREPGQSRAARGKTTCRHHPPG